MSTFLPKADEITRNWYVIDAAGKPLGRVASEAAVLLRGKHKPIFTPNVDCGDFVIIINTDKAVLTSLTRSFISITQVISVTLRKLSTAHLWLKRVILLCSLLLRV